MTTPPDLFALALQSQRAGNLQQAEVLCGQVLERDPENANALNLLGVLAHQAGRNDRAIDWLRRAVAANPRDGTIHYNLGVAYQMLGRNAEAVASYRQALQLLPDHADCHHNLGLLLRDDKQGDEAVTCFRRAAQLQPQSAVFHSDLANLLVPQGRPEEALPHYQQAVRLQPNEAAHHSNLANVLILLGRPDEAEAHCREALRLRPAMANALHNLAIARSCQGYLDEAIDINARAIRLQPDHAGANNCQALWSLQKGDFEQGWREYKWRWDIPNAVLRDFRQPIWDGSPLAGRTILLHAEQGLGDTIQFIRYAPQVKECGGTVVVECQPALIPLLGRSAGIDRLVVRGSALPAFDVHAPLLDLPRIFRTTLATIPAQVPYLEASPELVEHWRQELQVGPASRAGPSNGEVRQVPLGSRDLLRIGIAWQGNPKFPGDTLRSIALRHFAALARRDGVRLVSLQKGTGREQLAVLLTNFHVIDLAGRLDESSGAFMDTAAVMKNLDLVVTTDTAVAHLAGRWGCRSGWPWGSVPTGATSWIETTAPGIRRCACFASSGCTSGTSCSSGSPPPCPPRMPARAPRR